MACTLTDVPPHPAEFSAPLIPLFARLLDAHLPRAPRVYRVLDPFAGVGNVHRLMGSQSYEYGRRQLVTTGVELMPRWAAAHPRTIVGDATRLPARWTGRFDAVVTSPCYGNRFADHHQAFDASYRRSYRHLYGDTFKTDAPLDRNAGAMQWGDQYRALHAAAWTEARRVVRPGGLLILNIKDHYRGGHRQRVEAWHRRTIQTLGFARLETVSVPLAGFRRGENLHAANGKVRRELVYVFQRDRRVA